MVTAKIEQVCKLRDKWLYKPTKTDHVGCVFEHGEICLDINKMKNKLPKSAESMYSISFNKGVMNIINKNTKQNMFEEKTFDEYLSDLSTVMDLVSFGPAKTMTYRRLQILQSRFTLHLWLNDHIEVAEVKSIPHRDFYNVRKIDNHVHHSACMQQKHLLRFIKRKIEKEPNTKVFKKKNGEQQTLTEVFEEIGLSAKVKRSIYS